jgi:hypothetical protein
MAVFCTGCGSPLDESARFWKQTGAPRERVVGLAASTSNPVKPMPSPAPAPMCRSAPSQGWGIKPSLTSWPLTMPAEEIGPSKLICVFR